MMGVIVVTGGCQSHLPMLDNEKHPNQTIVRPRTTDVIDRVQCDLARIVNYPASADARLTQRVESNARLKALLPFLADDHFVASAQISLEVTDMEGLAPSLSFMNAAATHVVGLGGQWSNTQDRSITINYSIDLASLKKDDYETRFCRNKSGSSGLTGNLGLADIVADGMLALDESNDYNIYGNSGPNPLSVTQEFTGSSVTGTIKIVTTGSPPAQGSRDAARGPVQESGRAQSEIRIASLVGNILVAPQGVGTPAQGTVAVAGVVTLVGRDNSQSVCLVNWTGSILPISGEDRLLFSLSGGLLPEPGKDGLNLAVKWGLAATVTVAGEVARDLTGLKLAGVLQPAAGSEYEAKTLVTVTLSESTQGTPLGGHHVVAMTSGGPGTTAASGGPSGAKSAPTGSSAGGTSFGSLVDFVLVYGANGSPSYTFQNVKGLTGASAPLFNLMRTKTDTLAITFVASCRDFREIKELTPMSFWDSIGPCDELGFSQSQSQGAGFQNNSLMILRNFLIRP